MPADLVKRFAGSAMAITGYETDAVRRTPAGDVSVPINMAYNHHHDVNISSTQEGLARQHGLARLR